MTAENEVRTEVSEVSKVENAENCALDMSSSQDLPKFGADCNGIDHVDGDREQHINVNDNGRDDPDNSYVFVSGRDGVIDDPIDKDLITDDVLPESDGGSKNKAVDVKVGELNVEIGEIARSSVEGDNCVVVEGMELTDVPPPDNDVVPEGSVRKAEGDGIIVEMSKTVEEPNGRPAIEVELRQLNAEVIVGDQISESADDNLESQHMVSELAAESGESQESVIVSSEATGSDDVQAKSEKQNNLESTAQLGESQGPILVSSEASDSDDDKVKSEEQNNLESTAQVGESQEPVIVLLEARDSNDVKVRSEERNNLESTAQLGESRESEIVSSEASDSNDVKAKSEEQNNLESTAQLRESPEPVIISSEASDTDDQKSNSEEQNSLESTAQLGESQEPVIISSKVSDSDDVKAKSEEQKNLESTAQLGGSQEPVILSSDASDSDDVQAKSEGQNYSESTAQLLASQDYQNVVLDAAECRSPEVEVGEVKSVQQTGLDSAGEVEESVYHTTITTSAESDPCQLRNGEKRLEEERKTDSATDLKEDKDYEIVVNYNIQSGLDQAHEAVQLVNGTDATVETASAGDPVSDENKDSLPTSHGRNCVLQTPELDECMDDSHNTPELNGFSEDGERKTDSATDLKENQDSEIVNDSQNAPELNGFSVDADRKPDLATDLKEAEDSEIVDDGQNAPELNRFSEDADRKLDLATDLKEDQDSEIVDSSQNVPELNGFSEDLERKTDLATDLKEDQDSEIVVSHNIQSGLDQGHEAVKLVNGTDATVETRSAVDPVPDEYKSCLPISNGRNCVSKTPELDECMDDSQCAPELNGFSEDVKSLPSANCTRAEIETGSVLVEGVESIPIDSGENIIVKKEVGYGASVITEKSPQCAADVTISETEFRISDAKNRGSIVCSPVDNAKSDIVAENGPVGGDITSSSPATGVSSGTEFGLGSVPQEKTPTFQCDDIVCEVREAPTDAERDQNQPISTKNVNTGYHVNGSLKIGSGADVNSESEVETSSAISSRDMPCEDAVVSKSEVLDISVADGKGASSSIPEIVDVDSVEDGLSGEGGTSDQKATCQESEDVEAIQRDGILSLPKSSTADAAEGQNVDAEDLRRPFYFLIRFPRFEDEKLKEQIRHAQVEVDEKTRCRDAIRVEIQKKRANCQAHNFDYDAALSEVRAARRLVKSKRKEIDSVQSVINRVQNAISIEDIDSRIHNMEHMMVHETLPLKEEKQIIREIKQLKYHREQLSSNIGTQDEVQQALDQRDQTEGHLKILKKELQVLKDRVSKAEAVVKAASKKFDDESLKIMELQSQFKAADDIRQEAYTYLQSLRKQMFEKNKNFRMYKDDAIAANDYASSGDRMKLHHLCVKQVETVMELWNKNDDFRNEYVRCNKRSTLRRFGTLDHNPLGSDEEPPVLPSYEVARIGRLVSSPGKANSMSQIPTLEQEKQISSTVDGEVSDGKSITKVAGQKNQIVKTKNPMKPILGNGLATFSGRDKTEDTKEEGHIQIKEEQELARKEEELREEEGKAKLKEQLLLEEKAKAKEALERKKRNAEKAQIRAELRAQKEAEEKEKEREKRLRKKEKKKASAADAHDDGETAPTSEIPTETIEPEFKEGPTTVIKRSQKPTQLAKQSKTKSIPPPLRNRGKKRIEKWLWIILPCLIILALFILWIMG